MTVAPPTLKSRDPVEGKGLAVRLEGVTKTFGKQVAVDNLSLSVPEGSIYGFIGPNGSGKTTTIRMILHIFFPDSGTVEVLGERTTRAANDQVGYLPEERGLYKKQTVRRALTYFAALKGMHGMAARTAIGDWLDRMGLADCADKKIEALSKGMAQKIQFISAVVAQPRLLILDEPFSGLDPVNAEVIRESILDLRRQGTTVIFSTHDMGVAEKMCDAIFMIFKGRKVLDGDLAGIKAAYGTDVCHISGEGDLGFLSALPGVEHVRDLGRYREVRFRGDSQELLREVAGRIRVRHFEVASPSLHDIFVRIAGPRAAEIGEGGGNG